MPVLSGTLRLSFRRGLGRRCVLALAFLGAILYATSARAQDNHEIQVYGSELFDPGHTMVELHSNFTIDGSKTIIDGVYPTNHAEHETVEITHGFTDYFEYRCGGVQNSTVRHVMECRISHPPTTRRRCIQSRLNCSGIRV